MMMKKGLQSDANERRRQPQQQRVKNPREIFMMRENNFLFASSSFPHILSLSLSISKAKTDVSRCFLIHRWNHKKKTKKKERVSDITQSVNLSSKRRRREKRTRGVVVAVCFLFRRWRKKMMMCPSVRRKKSTSIAQTNDDQRGKARAESCLYPKSFVAKKQQKKGQKLFCHFHLFFASAFLFRSVWRRKYPLSFFPSLWLQDMTKSFLFFLCGCCRNIRCKGRERKKKLFFRTREDGRSLKEPFDDETDDDGEKGDRGRRRIGKGRRKKWRKNMFLLHQPGSCTGDDDDGAAAAAVFPPKTFETFSFSHVRLLSHRHEEGRKAYLEFLGFLVLFWNVSFHHHHQSAGLLKRIPSLKFDWGRRRRSRPRLRAAEKVFCSFFLLFLTSLFGIRRKDDDVGVGDDGCCFLKPLETTIKSLPPSFFLEWKHPSKQQQQQP